ncbi:MAG TPA: molybdopterin-dependent oxidoreductase [Polyangiaceae bacterium]
MSERLFTCNLCEAQCGLRVEVDGARVGKVRGDPEDVLSKGHVCPKAFALKELYDDPRRVRAPLRRTSGGWEKTSWDQALGDVATRLRDIRRRHGRDAVALYVGNPVAHSHRAALGSQLLTMAVGSKNRFDPNSQDSNPRLFACMHVYGDALSIPVPDVDRTDHLLILGANPAASNGSQMGLGDVRARMRGIRERGGVVVLVDPRRTESAAWATRHHFIRPGGDAALLLALLHVVFAEGREHPSARTGTSHLGSLRRLAAGFPPSRVAPAIGVGEDAIRGMALELVDARTSCVYARVGVCQNEFGPMASWLVEAINVVTGNFDREGGAMFPTPPADVAPLGRALIGNHWGRWRSRVRGLPEFLGALPSAAMAEEMETPGPGQVRALVCLAGDPVLTTPNGPRLARALRGLELVVGIDLYVNETLRDAHYVLPSKHVFETGNFDLLLSRFSVRNVAKYSPPIVSSGDDTRDDWDILRELSARLTLPGALQALAVRAGHDLPERVVDLLLRLGPGKLSMRALREAPHGVDLGPLVPSRRDRVRTQDRNVDLAPQALVADVERLGAWVDARRVVGDLVLIGRRHLRSNNSWMNGLPSLAKGPDRTHLLMHPDDAARAGVATGARVRVKSRAGSVAAVVEVTADVMPGVVSLPHGFSQCSANALTDEALVEPVIGTSILNGVPVTVESADP